jgi:hypothetical protein
VVPPLTGVAVNVTEAPAHTGLAGTPTIVTDAGTGAVTTIVIAVDVAVVGTAHGELDVIITVTLSPFTNVVDVNVTPVAPATFTPFTCH